MLESLKHSRFIRACRREPTDATPVWFMRQAGRYMPEYRAIRETVSMLDAIRTPEIAHRITMQPIHAFNLDAAILFADILIPLIPMGIDLDFIKGEGPQIETPIRTMPDVERLQTPPAADSMPYIAETVRSLAAELTPRNIPLIGFAGAPFTLASYAIEGGGSKNYEHSKGMMWNAPQVWHAFMQKLVITLTDYLTLQARAGAAALQIFDSWAGALGARDYATYAAPYTRALIQNVQALGVPVIYFSTGTGALLDQIRDLGSEVVSVDWRLPLDRAWDAIGHDKAIQGNLDPVMLFAEWDVIKTAVDEILDQAGGRPGHIFNLGHGILPGTPVDTVRRLADYVHERTQERIRG
jgi:uroporphyrinogen decarboxylase